MNNKGEYNSAETEINKKDTAKNNFSKKILYNGRRKWKCFIRNFNSI